MKIQKFFELAKEKGIEASQISISKSKTTKFSVFHGELSNFGVSEDYSIDACGVVNGKFGAVSTQKMDNSSIEWIANGIIKAASLSEKESAASIFPGSDKYHKKNVYNKELAEVTIENKLALVFEIEKALFAYDPRITEAEVSYEESESTNEFYNSYGLKLKDKGNYFYIVAEVCAKDGENVKTGFKVTLTSDFKSFNKDEFVKKTCDDALSKIGADSYKSGKYPTVLKNSVFASLMNYFVHSTIADEVQKGSSFLAGKLGTKIANNKITIEEKPLTPNVFFSYFDAEGVAKKNKTIVKNGVLLSYLYNRESAAKDGVDSTGNAVLRGGRIDTGYSNIAIKGGKKNFEEMISSISKGVYITDIQGLGTGMNPRSGNFSCQAQGFLIEDGKVTSPLTLITLSGNLFEMLNHVSAFDNNCELQLSSISCSDALIKSMSIGGK